MPTEQVVKPRPFLRWAGSKRQIVRRLAAFWKSSFLRYVEPFAGSSALFFEIQPPHAVLADKNGELIEVYDVLRQNPDALYKELTTLANDRLTYYALRNQLSAGHSPFQRAIRFLYLNRYCFNGIYRTNAKGHFNVPYAPSGTGTFPTLSEFRACARLLRSVSLRTWDFGTTLRYTRRGDFIYLDPPYAVGSRRVFREYGPKAFTEHDLLRLGAHLLRVHRKGAIFLLSYADCAEARRIFQRWTIHRIRVRRNVAGFTGARRNAIELLISNAKAKEIS